MNIEAADGILGRWEAEVMAVSSDEEIEKGTAWADVPLKLRQIRAIRELILTLDTARLTKVEMRRRKQSKVRPSAARERELRALYDLALAYLSVDPADAASMFVIDEHTGRLNHKDSDLRARVWWHLRNVCEWLPEFKGKVPSPKEIMWITTGRWEHTTVFCALKRIDEARKMAA